MARKAEIKNESLLDKIDRLRNEKAARKFGDVYREESPYDNIKRKWKVKCIHGVETFNLKRNAVAYSEEYKSVMAKEIAAKEIVR